MFKNKDYVIRIFKEGSFSRAAEKLYISQPSLSASVKRIEDKIGFPIFDRSTSPVTLTDVGKEYIRVALEIEKEENGFARYIEDYGNLITGKIRLGGSSMFSSFVIPTLIGKFKEVNPGISFEVYEDSTKNLMKKLLLGELDIVIDNTSSESDATDSIMYRSEVLLLAVPQAFKINEKLKGARLYLEDVKRDAHLAPDCCVSIEEFADEPFILLNPENDTGARAEALFKEHSISPRVIFNLDQQVTAFNVSASGLGISFISDTLIKATTHLPELYFYRPSGEGMERAISFYKKKNSYLSLAARKFIEYSVGKGN